MKMDNFNVRLIRTGETYGRNNAMTHTFARTMVEISVDGSSFAVRYYIANLLESTGGLVLQGTLGMTPAQMTELRKYLKEQK